MMRSGIWGLSACLAVMLSVPLARADEVRLQSGGSFKVLFGAGGRPVGSLAGGPTAPGAPAKSRSLAVRLSPPGGTGPEQYLFIQGDVGEVNLGLGAGVPYAMQFTAPFSAPTSSGSPALDAVPRGGSARAANYVLLSGESYRLGYFTPRFAGTGGASLSVAEVAGAEDARSAASRQRLSETYRSYKLGASYVARFDRLDLALSAEREGAHSERGLAPDPGQWTLGFGLSYSGLKIGGAYYQAEDMLIQSPALPAVKERGYTFGLGYGGSDWWIGTGMSRLMQQLDHHNAAPNATTAYRLGGEYKIAPGMLIYSDVLLYSNTNDSSRSKMPSADDSRAIFLGVDLNF